MIIDINNLIALNKFSSCKGCSTLTIKKAIKKGYVDSINLDKEIFVKLNQKAYEYSPKKIKFSPEPLREPIKPLFIDTDKLLTIKEYSQIKNISYEKAINHVVEHQELPHIRIEHRIFILMDEKTINSLNH